MGRNQVERMKSVFTVDMIITTIVSLVVSAIIIFMATTDLTAVMAPDSRKG